VSRSKNVVGNASVVGTGRYCITLDSSINKSTAVVLAQTDFGSDASNTNANIFGLARFSSNLGCGTNQVGVVTLAFDGDGVDDNDGRGDENGDSLSFVSQPFVFAVP
jgi:hypothetical protein